MTDLFQSGSFRLHSGATSSFKIDCDALSDTDIRALAGIAYDHILPPFSRVFPIPTGGNRLAAALEPYADININGPDLYVDDVLTTGQSLLERLNGNRRYAIGLVIFSRLHVRDARIYTMFQFGGLRRLP